MKTAIMVNNEVVFTEDENLINTNELASYEDALDKISEGNDYGIQDEDLVQAQDGIGIINDGNGLELLVRC